MTVQLLLSLLGIAFVVLLLTLQHLVGLHRGFLHVAQILEVLLSRRIVQVSEVHSLVVESPKQKCQS